MNCQVCKKKPKADDLAACEECWQRYEDLFLKPVQGGFFSLVCPVLVGDDKTFVDRFKEETKKNA